MIFYGPGANPHKKQKKGLRTFGASVLTQWRFGANPPKPPPTLEKRHPPTGHLAELDSSPVSDRPDLSALTQHKSGFRIDPSNTYASHGSPTHTLIVQIEAIKGAYHPRVCKLAEWEEYSRLACEPIINNSPSHVVDGTTQLACARIRCGI